MNRKILVIFVAVLGLVMLAPTAMAIGPWEAAEPNPHLAVLDGVLTLQQKNGLFIRWHDDSAVVSSNVYKLKDITMYRPASKGDATGEIKDAAIALIVWDGPPPMSKLNNVFTVKLGKDDAMALEYENKWIYMSNDYVHGYFTLGYGPEMGDYFAELWPYGVYYKYVNVG